MGKNKLSKVVELSSKKFSDYVLENYNEDVEVMFGESDVEIKGDLYGMFSFHAEDVHMLEAHDEYLFGIRAHHFVVEEGWSEGHAQDAHCLLVSANHKGNRIQKLFVEK